MLLCAARLAYAHAPTVRMIMTYITFQGQCIGDGVHVHKLHLRVLPRVLHFSVFIYDYEQCVHKT